MGTLTDMSLKWDFSMLSLFSTLLSTTILGKREDCIIFKYQGSDIRYFGIKSTLSALRAVPPNMPQILKQVQLF